MNDFILYVREGFFHVLDINAYDHILFITLLALPYLFSHWRQLLSLVTFFTIGHTVSLFLVAYGDARVSSVWIEFLIPVSIAMAAVYNIITAKKRPQSGLRLFALLVCLFFGLVHGFGFGSEYRMLAAGAENDFLMCLEFALGIELSQIAIVIIVVLLHYLVTQILRIARRDWILVVSSVIIGMVIPMLIERWP